MEFAILHEFPPVHLEAAWRDCLTRVECPSHYNAPEFFREPFWSGRGPFAALALEGDAVAGILTGLREGDRVNAGLPSRPQICVDATRDRTAVLDVLGRGLLHEAAGAKLVSAYTWPSLTLEPFERLRFRHRRMQGNVVLDLTQPPEELFRQLGKKRRNLIRSAIKQGVEVCPARIPEDLAECYDVYCKWLYTTRRKQIHGSQMPQPTFEQTFRQTKNRRLFVARYEGKIVACSAFRFFPGGLIEYSENFGLEAFFRLRPNDLLQWRVIEWACEEGFPRYSLGGSHLFLRQAGGVVVPIYRYRLDRTGLRHHDRGEALRDLGRAALSKMPPAVEKTIRRVLGREKQAGW